MPWPEPPPGLEAPVAEVRDALARTKALFAARQHDEALAVARKAADGARALSDKAALLMAEGEGEPAVAAARRSVELCTEVLGAAHPRTVHYRVTLGEVLDGNGDLPEAARVLLDVASVDQGDGTLATTFARARYVLSGIFRKQGRYEDAIAEARAAEAAVVRSWGEAFAPRVQLLSTISLSLNRLGRSEEALEVAQQALTLERRIETIPIAVASIHEMMGRALQGVGRRSEALEHAETALGTIEEEFGSEGFELVSFLSLRGELRLERGDVEGALEDLRRADALFVAHGRLDDVERPYGLLQLASALLQLGRAAEAIEAVERGYEIWEGSGISAQRRARAQFELAKARWTVPPERERAVVAAREARRLDVEAGEVALEHRAEVEAWLDARTDRGAK